jgi:hypothetical protein
LKTNQTRRGLVSGGNNSNNQVTMAGRNTA